MLICNPYEIVIQGITSNGKTFRPSDWSERLCGILSSFDNNRLSYHDWVRPILVDNVRCVAVDKKLEQINESMFRFLMDFAQDNDLRVIDCKALLEEQGAADGTRLDRALQAQAEAEAESKAAAAPPAAEAAEVWTARELAEEEWHLAYVAFRAVLPESLGQVHFNQRMGKLSAQGVRIAVCFNAQGAAAAACLFSCREQLAGGAVLHIETLAGLPQTPDAAWLALIHAVQAAAHAAHCTQIAVAVSGGDAARPLWQALLAAGLFAEQTLFAGSPTPAA